MIRLFLHLLFAAGALVLPLVLILLLGSCQADGDRMVIAPAAVTERHDRDTPELAAEVNNARAAAMVVSTMSPVADAAIRQEIQLWSALFNEVIKASGSRHILLSQPEIDEMPLSGMSGMSGMSNREFRLRVLAELASAPVMAAWAVSDSSGLPQMFPGTREPAARVQVDIRERDRAAAEITAEWSVQHPKGGGMRQGVQATWDGRAWSVESENIRLEW